MSECATPTPQAVFERLKEATGSVSDADLARNLGIAPTTISTWRRREAIPYEECAKVALANGISLDFLIFGRFSAATPPLVQLDQELLRACIGLSMAMERQFVGTKLSDAWPQLTVRISERVARFYVTYIETILSQDGVDAKSRMRGKIISMLERNAVENSVPSRDR